MRLTPYDLMEKPCAFYGFIFNENSGVMWDARENRCALAMMLDRPYSLYQNTCQMELMRDKPNWCECPLNTEENRSMIKKYSKKVRVFPKEHSPPKGIPWKGWTLKKWMKYMARKKELVEE